MLEVWEVGGLPEFCLPQGQEQEEQEEREPARLNSALMGEGKSRGPGGSGIVGGKAGSGGLVPLLTRA